MRCDAMRCGAVRCGAVRCDGEDARGVSAACAAAQLGAAPGGAAGGEELMQRPEHLPNMGARRAAQGLQRCAGGRAFVAQAGCRLAWLGCEDAGGRAANSCRAGAGARALLCCGVLY